MLIGMSASMLLLLNGRIAGISGIVGRLVQGTEISTNAAFVVGLLSGPLLYLLLFGQWPSVTITSSLPVIAVGGFFVGFGTRMGSGCTSGHGVLGLARLSQRSIVAVATFVASAMMIVFLMRTFGS
jgi:uncharacterized membrane protein YedE/YeeE